MTDENLFNPVQTNDGVEPPQAPVLPDNVKDLVGPGKKYATVEKALEALVHSQDHIARIEAENADIRARAEAALSVEQVHETVQELLKKERETRGPVSVDEAALSGVLDRALTQREQQKIAKENANAVVGALSGKFGEKAQEQYELKAKELGLSVADLNELSKKSPKAVLGYFGISEKAPVVVRTHGSINTTALNNNSPLPEKPKSPMSGGTTKDIQAMWDYAKKKVIQQE